MIVSLRLPVLAALAVLTGCVGPTAPVLTPTILGGPGPGEGAAVAPAPARPALAALPTQGCTPPTPGQVAVRRGQIASVGSVQIYYTGRDETFRYEPFIYMFESNAQLINRSGTRREASFFGLWRNATQVAVACGRNFAISYARISDDEATLNIRSR